ncbi:MAG: hypothetical protein COA57_03390 [Flavobacteriales bacterium]|nr:MAG: hypothetical protein COA57_03390 [Flavobacteriales bacterium]
MVFLKSGPNTNAMNHLKLFTTAFFICCMGFSYAQMHVAATNNRNKQSISSYRLSKSDQRKKRKGYVFSAGTVWFDKITGKKYFTPGGWKKNHRNKRWNVKKWGKAKYNLKKGKFLKKHKVSKPVEKKVNTRPRI